MVYRASGEPISKISYSLSCRSLNEVEGAGGAVRGIVSVPEDESIDPIPIYPDRSCVSENPSANPSCSMRFQALMDSAIAVALR